MQESLQATAPPRSAAAAPLLEVADLAVRFSAEDGPVQAVRGVDLALAAGEILGIVGESGSGKSVTCQALLGLLPPSAAVAGRIAVDGAPVAPGDADGFAALRGTALSMIFQDPMSALDPLMSVRGHLMQRLRRHGAGAPGGGADEAAALALLSSAGVPDPGRVLDAYAHQLSGGLCQRVAIALALAGRPRLLVADEPTTALDVTIQAQVLDLLADLSAERGLAVILISHDLGVVAEICDRIAVMYAGQVVETGPAEAVLSAPAHPYTRALLASRPRLDGPRQALRPIPGAAPAPGELPAGCAFAPRCPAAVETCAGAPTLRGAGPGRLARCHFAPSHG
ncbi:MAG: ABC transporter ATP-binding protein [Pseudomonadota bacterium]